MLSEAVHDLGIRGVVSLIYSRLFRPRIESFEILEGFLAGKSGIEIGGPSKIFERNNLIPIYPIVSRLDGCNFAKNTLWSRNDSAYFFQKGKECGRHYINEAVELKEIENDQYDFLLASHVIEHCANPIKAIMEWRRVVNEDGGFLFVIPHKDRTFDHARPITTLGHIIDDFEKKTEESDLTHLSEIIAQHDLRRDPLAGSFEDFRLRSEKNLLNRTLHHHVFDTYLAAQLLNRCGIKLLFVENALPYHIVLFGKKCKENEEVDNREFLADDALFRKRSPFRSDLSR
jgi:SAM-dependent methyltransferase